MMAFPKDQHPMSVSTVSEATQLAEPRAAKGRRVAFDAVTLN